MTHDVRGLPYVHPLPAKRRWAPVPRRTLTDYVRSFDQANAEADRPWPHYGLRARIFSPVPQRYDWPTGEAPVSEPPPPATIPPLKRHIGLSHDVYLRNPDCARLRF